MNTTEDTKVVKKSQKGGSLEARILALEETVKNLTAKIENRRGPKSTRQMTEDDAKRIMLGDLKDKSHKEAADTLGLSYGQIYSARGGFTFKEIYKESQKPGTAKK